MAKVVSSLIDDMSSCIICGKYAELHHVFFGLKQKKWSDKYKFYLPLCYEHHRGNNGPHMNRKVDLAYKTMAQKHFEAHIGTREQFIHEFGRNYL